LSGLIAGQRLQKAGIAVSLLEQAKDVGGRMATLRVRAEGTESVFDYGAQFFTVREPGFAHIVSEWQEAGLIEEWSRGFATADGSYYADGHPRYRGREGMTQIMEYMARSLNILLNCSVKAITYEPGAWIVVDHHGARYAADSLILTPPVPQSLALLGASNISIPEKARKALDKINYEPCIALIVQLDESSQLPEPGGLWSLGEPIAWLADNHLKGISPSSGAITIHAGPEFSQAHWNDADDNIMNMLIHSAGDWISQNVSSFRVFRWQYSKPLWIHAEPYLAVDMPEPLVFVGDAFAGPRVEGAALSGLAAADWMRRQEP
jgi:predicted NAD/FAD-dependent oxidoreductase